MSVGIAVRRRSGAEGPIERCPYCHDVLDEARSTDDEVRCEGCGTAHHRACIAELGRCTVTLFTTIGVLLQALTR